MYAVLQYFNYRKDISFQLLKSFYDFEKAKEYALQCAEKECDGKVVDGVSEKWVEVDNELIEGFTTGNGYCKFVFTVVEIPKPEE